MFDLTFDRNAFILTNRHHVIIAPIKITRTANDRFYFRLLARTNENPICKSERSSETIVIIRSARIANYDIRITFCRAERAIINTNSENTRMILLV